MFDESEVLSACSKRLYFQILDSDEEYARSYSNARRRREIERSLIPAGTRVLVVLNRKKVKDVREKG